MRALRLVPVLLLLIGCGKDPSDPAALAGSVESIDSLPINRIQVIGSHNSYRRRTPSPLFEFLLALDWILPGEYKTKQLDYTHEPLADQLDQYRMRSFEFDFYHDPDGGRFYYRQGNKLVGQSTDSGVPELKLPGSKMLHIADVDYLSHFPTLSQGLAALRDWSDAHPTHLPIFVLMEPKDDSLDDTIPWFGFTKVLKWDAAAMAYLEQEVAAVFQANPSKIFTPAELRGDAADLPTAIATKGWPALAQMRGRIVFLLFAPPGYSPGLMFPFSEPGQPDAAFVRYDDPVKDYDKIRAAVEAGYMVRTRADDGTVEARSGDTARRDKAFASGAQIVCTDYYRPDKRWSDYAVVFPDGASGRTDTGQLVSD
ncbi:MAG: hypothetical protein HYY17_03270 [Planctomycetes bacterium]|nr:hypothetical protein [Planctomycetota bacterium]